MWGGGCLFIYSCYIRLISFEINSNSKEIRRSEDEYVNYIIIILNLPQFTNDLQIHLKYMY